MYKVQIFSVTHIQFIVKKTFKATCFGSTEPSSGLFVRTDPYPITSTFGIPSVYNDGIYNAYTVWYFFKIQIEINIKNSRFKLIFKNYIYRVYQNDWSGLEVDYIHTYGEKTYKY